MVDLPDAERPVSQRVRPRWLRSLDRSGRVREGCQVMLLRVREGISLVLGSWICAVYGTTG